MNDQPQLRWILSESLRKDGCSGYNVCEDSDGYFAGVDDLTQTARGEGFDIPDDLVWCDFQRLQLDLDQSLEDAESEHHESGEWDDMATLVDFVNAWNAKQTGGTWFGSDEKLPPEMITMIREAVKSSPRKSFRELASQPVFPANES